MSSKVVSVVFKTNGKNKAVQNRAKEILKRTRNFKAIWLFLSGHFTLALAILDKNASFIFHVLKTQNKFSHIYIFFLPIAENWQCCNLMNSKEFSCPCLLVIYYHHFLLLLQRTSFTCWRGTSTCGRWRVCWRCSQTFVSSTSSAQWRRSSPPSARPTTIFSPTTVRSFYSDP